ncbi:hypothetical protein HAX54_047663, partial [Datura stramonium]|nr:hypothetical protein [Datura stramonium]
EKLVLKLVQERFNYVKLIGFTSACFKLMRDEALECDLNSVAIQVLDFAMCLRGFRISKAGRQGLTPELEKLLIFNYGPEL